MVLLLLTFCLLLLPLWESVIVLFFCTLFYVHSSIAIILMGKRELVALLNLSSWCHVMVEWLFLAVPWGCLRFVIVVFPDHTHLRFKNNHVPSISLILFEIGIPNLVCGCILGWRSVAYHFQVTVIMTSDQVFRIFVSGAFLSYHLR